VTTTTVRGASRSPASATTFHVGREGSRRRRNHWRPPVMSSAIAAVAKALALGGGGPLEGRQLAHHALELGAQGGGVGGRGHRRATI
jgi:hypothetical protein